MIAYYVRGGIFVDEGQCVSARAQVRTAIRAMSQPLDISELEARQAALGTPAIVKPMTPRTRERQEVLERRRLAALNNRAKRGCFFCMGDPCQLCRPSAKNDRRRPP